MGKDEFNKANIVFFDGVCHLCNAFVDKIITNDKAHVFKFAPLQGETAKSLLNDQDRNNLDSVIYFESGQVYRRSQAVLKILTKLGGPYVLFNLAWIIPGFIRDMVYGLIARNRYKWFGERDFCRIPTPEERSYLLD